MPPIGAIDGRALLALPDARGSIAQRGVLRLPAPGEDGGLEIAALRRMGARLGVLRGALDYLAELRGSLRAARRTGGIAAGRAAEALSGASLDLDPIASFTTLRGSAEVNTIPTSFTPFGPTVSGTSTTLPTLAGVYGGAQGDDVLTVRFRDTAVIGSASRLRVAVDDSDGNRVANLRFDNVAPGTPLAIGNGMALALGAGLAVNGGSFTVSVFQSVGSAVDPTKPFDGTRNEQPNFEPGLSVTAGSFELNGVAIDVFANDSIDGVLARITASAAGVDAEFDAASERILLTQRTAGSGAHIVLANDTSGFLAATKLAGAAEVAGQDGDDPVHQPIASVPSLAGIASGTFAVNGTPLAVDVDADSLADVLDRINAAGAGVTATLDPATHRVRVVASDPEAPLTLDDGSSGLFTALGIAPGGYEPVAARDAERRQPARFARPSALRSGLLELGRALNALLADGFGGLSGADLGALRGGIASAAAGAFAGSPGARPGARLGLSFDLSRAPRGAFASAATRLSRALERDAEALAAFLFEAPGRGAPGGLVTSLRERVEEAEGRLLGKLRALRLTGAQVDLRV
jgi:hypothetical protein